MYPIIFIPIGVVLVLLVSGGYIFVLACCGRKQNDWLDENWVKNSSYRDYNDCIQASHRWLTQNNAQDVYTTSREGLRLHALWIPAENARGTVLMAHGYRSTMLIDCHLGFELFHRLGFNILAPEQRTHGQSQGKFITFGVKESQDMVQWLRYYNSQLGKLPVILFGISMGASTMLYLADRYLPGQVRGIIADCGFTSPGEIIGSVYRRVVHLPPAVSLWVTGLYTRVFAGFDLWEKDTRKSLGQSRYPVLLIHGEGDDFVPCQMTRQAYDACTGPKRLLLVPEAGHGFSFVVDGKSYTAAVMDFLNEILPE